jgi:hypothetical protein
LRAIVLSERRHPRNFQNSSGDSPISILIMRSLLISDIGEGGITRSSPSHILSGIHIKWDHSCLQVWALIIFEIFGH